MLKLLRKLTDGTLAGGLLLMLAAALAVWMANSPWADLYGQLLNTEMRFQLGTFSIAKPLLLWINDGLMAVFFLLIGLEVKRELMVGRLSTPAQVGLPAFAALGGMVVPAMVYLAFNMDNPMAREGWAIPAATDIAFALGVLALLGDRVPGSLKIFLLALAILDDLGAIVIIALFYTNDLSTMALGVAGAALVGLVVLNRAGVQRLSLYAAVGLVLWVAVLKSGVHATLAGVAMAFTIPLGSSKGTQDGAVKFSPLTWLEHALHPWVSFLIVPVFAFANAGVPLRGLTWDALAQPVTLGIILGLFVGKQVGVFGFSWIAVKLGLARKPIGATWIHIYGVALLCGIGFTMSLFIGALAFEHLGDDTYLIANRLGILVGSLIAAIAGSVVLLLAPKDEGLAFRPDDD